MEFRIADTFTSSLTRLTGQEQKAVKTTVFDLQVNPNHPGLSFHKLDRVRDPNFASVRVNDDMRIIVHRQGNSLLLCYVDHHEQAYRWAERRKVEVHPATGAAQLVEIRETVEDIVIPNYVTEERPQPALFAKISEDTLLSYGVPVEWLADVRLATEDSLLSLADHLPAEAAEALLELATGGTPLATPVLPPGTDPFDHPDAMRRFRIMGDTEELARALEFPWEKWTVFLHPEQRRFATAHYNGPARVSGSAGTGKTVVALHRAAHLARQNPQARILLATFSETLASALGVKMRRLIHNQPRLGEQIEVYALDAIGERLYSLNYGKPGLATNQQVQEWLAQAAKQVGERSFSLNFLFSEWEQVVDAWQLTSWEAYRDVPRLGRKTRLPEARRQVLWFIFEQVQSTLHQQGLLTQASLFTILAGHYQAHPGPFDHVVLDEAQDVNIPQLKFLAALAGGKENGLFFAGDLGQRIFQQPFSWKALGVDVRGRSRTLRINYRTSHQIRSQADKLLGPELADVDGLVETRRGTVSVFNGPPPLIQTCRDELEEIDAVAGWLQQQQAQGIQPEEIGVFVRSEKEFPRARQAFQQAGIPAQELDQKMNPQPGLACLCTMHMAKGLEFRAVAVIACDDEIIPSQERIETVSDEADLEDVYNTERHLLYVACTRARDALFVSGVHPSSEFLDDMK